MDDRTKLLKENGLEILATALQKAVGRDVEFLDDAEFFDRIVVEPAWLAMPLAIRLIGKERLGWGRLFARLRQSVYQTHENRLQMRPDYQAKIGAVLDAAYRTDTPDALQPIGPETAIGIDLGTTFSVVAHLDSQGRPWSIPNASGDILTPSVVYFDESGPIVGKEAVKAGLVDPECLAECVKRDMGSRVYHKAIRGEQLPPEAISALILKNLKMSAEAKLGPVSKAVITVPAFFDEPRRRATMDAGRIAGLEVLDILNEPTAAAISFGMQLGFLDRSAANTQTKPMRIVVFDLGGGTFDVSIVEITGRQFRVLATDGDVRLGGKDWDERLAKFAAARFQEKTRENPLDNPVSATELLHLAEDAKRTLSELQKALMFVNHLGSRQKIEVTRPDFEGATSGLVRRTRTTCELVMRQANLDWKDIDRVILVGGSTRMPMISKMLEELSGKKPDRSVSPDEAVAHGAAFYAELLLAKQSWKELAAQRPQQPAISITNVNSHSLGVIGIAETSGQRVNRVLIRKNSPLPCAVTKRFQTQKPGQKVLKIVVLEGESPDPDACTHVGTLVVDSLPADLAAGSPIDVEYRYMENGQLEVTADVIGVQRARTSFVRDSRMDEADMHLWRRTVGQSGPI